MDRLTPQQRSRLMSRVRAQDTLPERVMRSALHRRGLRFRKNVRGLPGTPDIVFARARIAVFVDGDFWHGNGFGRWSGKLSPYWREKIERNRLRDERDAAALRELGWTVLRVWGSEIKADLDAVSDRVESAVRGAVR